MVELLTKIHGTLGMIVFELAMIIGILIGMNYV